MIGRQERIMVFGSLLREHGPEVLRRSRERTVRCIFHSLFNLPILACIVLEALTYAGL